MGDPSVPHEQEDTERLLATDDPAHGPGDLSALPESDLEEEPSWTNQEPGGDSQ